MSSRQSSMSIPMETPAAPAAAAPDKTASRICSKEVLDQRCLTISTKSTDKRQLEGHHVEVLPAVISISKHPVHGIALLLLNGDQGFLMNGDRHNWQDDLRTLWEKEFVGKVCPHTVYRVDYVIDDATKNAHGVGLRVPGEGTEAGNPIYSTFEATVRAIIMHMLKKKWVPICIFNAPGEAKLFANNLSKLSLYDRVLWVDSLPHENIMRLGDLLIKFTRAIKDLNLSDQEIIQGKVEPGDSVIDTLRKEAQEEALVTEDEINALIHEGKIEFVGFKYFKNREGEDTATACYVGHVDDLIQFQMNYDARAAALSQTSNWFCAHSFYTFLKGLNMEKMKVLKAKQENANGRFEPMETLLNKINDRGRGCATLIYDYVNATASESAAGSPKKKRKLSDESKQSERKVIVIDDSEKVCDALKKTGATVVKVPKLKKGEKLAEHQGTKPGLTALFFSLALLWQSIVNATTSHCVLLLDCDMTLFPASVNNTEMLTEMQLVKHLKEQQGITVGDDLWTQIRDYMIRFLTVCIEQSPIQVVLWTKNNKYNIIRRLVSIWAIPESLLRNCGMFCATTVGLTKSGQEVYTVRDKKDVVNEIINHPKKFVREMNKSLDDEKAGTERFWRV